MACVLVVDDDASIRRTLERLLGRQGHDVRLAEHGQQAIDTIRAEPIDLVLLDLGLPGIDGMQVLRSVRGDGDELAGPVVIVVSARDDMHSTVDAIQAGAYDYVIKPIDIHELMRVVDRALEEREVRRRLQGVRPERGVEDGEPLLVGRSPAMREVFKQVAQVAPHRSPVLILGESGTGKELAARAIHAASPRRREPFVAVNCAALSPGLLESELFGHRRGAYTGAVADRAGRLEVAGQGTLFLDEIGELAGELQAKLLRVLQEHTFERVGESTTRRLEARVLVATHRNLEAEVAAGRFREDLYYRLRVVEIRLPTLRERPEDIPLLVQRLLARVEVETGKQVQMLDENALELLQRHGWPGNVRELYNVLQRAVVLSRGPVVTAQSIALAGLEGGRRRSGAVGQSLSDVEREHILNTLREAGWQKKRTAELLGISRPTLDRKIKAYELERERET